MGEDIGQTDWETSGSSGEVVLGENAENIVDGQRDKWDDALRENESRRLIRKIGREQ